MNAIDTIRQWCSSKGYAFSYGNPTHVNWWMGNTDFSASTNGTAVFCHLLTASEYDGSKDSYNVGIYFATLCDFDFDNESIDTTTEALKERAKALLTDLSQGNSVGWSGARFTYGYDDYAENVVWCCMRVTLTALAAECVEMPTPTLPPYLYFEAKQANSTVSMVSYLTTAPDMEYSTDGSTFQEWQHTTSEGTHTFDTITLGAVGDKVYFRGTNAIMADTDNNQASVFLPTGDVKVGGSVQSLVDGTGDSTTAIEFGPLFASSLFGGSATALTEVESGLLPATTLADGCYASMFHGCTALTTAPTLPATTLASDCYSGMFFGCSALTTAPALPATTLAEGCYNGMFNGCTALTTAPTLPATTLAEYCYGDMFNGCSSLNSVTCLATDISANSCTADWLDGVAAIGTFTKAAAMSGWTEGASGIPSGWTILDYE